VTTSHQVQQQLQQAHHVFLPTQHMQQSFPYVMRPSEAYRQGTDFNYESYKMIRVIFKIKFWGKLKFLASLTSARFLQPTCTVCKKIVRDQQRKFL
jgi:hypothetical protein